MNITSGEGNNVLENVMKLSQELATELASHYVNKMDDNIYINNNSSSGSKKLKSTINFNSCDCFILRLLQSEKSIIQMSTSSLDIKMTIDRTL